MGSRHGHYREEMSMVQGDYNMDRLTTMPIRQSLNGGDAVRLLNETGRRVMADLKRVFKTNTMKFEKVRSEFFRGMMI